MAPFVSLPLIAVLAKSGASIGTKIAFITSWSLIAVNRLPMEIGILGWKFVLYRLSCTFLFAPLSGVIAQIFFKQNLYQLIVVIKKCYTTYSYSQVLSPGRRKNTEMTILIKVEFSDVKLFLEEYSENITKGGIFLITKLSINSKVTLSFHLPHSENSFEL